MSGVNPSNIKNRPEIDGLRAIAVMLVVFYHTALGFPGGYIGVDVFFVISGYLITSIILNDIYAKKFQILNFWERRVRRILPALAVVVLACLIAGWFMFFPADFKALGRSVIYQSLLISNVFFWKTTGYFSATGTQPLLHTWSLALEEQFYIFFPFLLLALTRFANRMLISSLAGCILISFVLGVCGTYYRPTAAFYLLPSRAWELLLGALLAALPNLQQPPKWINEFLSWTGLFGILFAALIYDKNTPFPGFAALAPCFGTILIIWTNGSSITFVGKMLSLRPIVFIGLISYSLYLWHWPVLIFMNYWAQGQPSLTGGLEVIAISMILAIITWKIIETPFRKRLFFPGRAPVFAFAGVALATLFFAGRVVYSASGFSSRWSPEALQYAAGQEDKDFRIELDLASAKSGHFIPIGYKGTDRPIDLFVWGDSHAMAVLHVLDVVCAKDGVRAVAATHSSTIPLLDFPCSTTYSLHDDTIPYNRAIATFVQEQKIKNVLLVAAWNGYIPPILTQPGKNKFDSCLTETIDTLHQAGAKVFIMEDVPKQKFDVPRGLAIAVRFGRDPSKLGLPINEQLRQTASVNKTFDQVANSSVVLLDPTGILTDQSGLCRSELDGKALYFDQQHLTIFGEMQLQPMFEHMLNQEMIRATMALQPKAEILAAKAR